MQPAQIRHSLLTNKEQLVEEYAEANNLGELDATRQNIDAAIRYMHKILLADLRPPWATHTFPQAVPGDGVLSRYIRPSFMQWDSGLGAKLLGTKVWELVGDAAAAVNVAVAGYLARPLYVCTNASPSSENGMCMSIASMSRFVQQAPGQVHYRCSACVAKSEGVPVSDSAPLRVLHLQPFQNELRSLCDESGSNNVTPKDFVERAHKRGLQVTILKDADQEARRDEYAKLLERFPGSTERKVGGDQLLTPEGRARAVVQLVSKHSGELVELDRSRAGWVLRPVVPGSASTMYSDQWLCRGVKLIFFEKTQLFC